MQLLALALLISAAALPLRADRAGAHSNALWTVVRACTLNSRVTGAPWPCLAVDRRRGFTVIADPKRPTQLLVTPTTRVTGIESAALMAPGVPNFWWLAWSSRAWLDRRAQRAVPPDDVGLAVNSVPGRTQDQLHVHIDCLRPSVRRAIDADLADVSETWADVSTPLFHGHRYRGRWMAKDALQSTDPFRLLFEDPEVGNDHSVWTLVMVAAERPSGGAGFVLLSHKADLASHDLAAGEELLDHRCGILRAGRPKP